APTTETASHAWAAGILAAYPDLPSALAGRARVAVDAPPRPSTELPVGAWAELVAAIAIDTHDRGASALIVVPDQRDQDQVLAVLAAHAPESAIVRDDARRSGPERYGTFLRLLDGEPAIVVGNRSTVYAPAPDVGAVIIWDDGDPLLGEPLSPGIHARDAALIRQELEGSALVFAGHTRTTDVERLVQLGWVADVPARRRESPTVVLSATREGENRGQRVPSAAFAAARAALQEGPVLVQVARPGYAPVLVCAQCRTPARCPHCTGPLRARRPGAAPECTWCGRTISAWACGNCQGTTLRMASSGSERTADELGRAFPHTRVILADGDHPVTTVDARPALVVATRGAEPAAVGGYRAVILLDGDRMLLAEQLRIGESALRWWSNAAALATPGAPVHLVGVAGPVARALATWTQPAYARAELADRVPLQMPPTVRVASLEGSAAAVGTALETLRAAVPTLGPGAILGPVPREDGGVRALIRFEYGLGRAVAEQLRAAVVADALHARRTARAAGDRFAPRSTLRVRLDVPELDL
ncbi:MAG TPA: primosomal protein N', partial [Microbacterium sp.]|nr:primosomal protein N' [Microbacterium sp.]